MSTDSQKFLVRRTCTQKTEQGQAEGLPQPLDSYRDTPAYVLLGDPGAGKTESFKQEAQESGGMYVRARDFVIPEFCRPKEGETIFIDGLDEVPSAGDSRHPFDRIRERLIALGNPSFRLSCREADWLGKSGETDMQVVSPDGQIVVLYLDALNDDDIIAILEHHPDITDYTDFIDQAKNHGLYELLRNPQTLDMLIKAVGGGAWPRSRTEVYKMACRTLAQETNPEHKQAVKESTPSVEAVLQAAGYLNAIYLIAGCGGFDPDCDDDSEQFVCLRALKESQLPLVPALKCNLFRVEGNTRTPVHRSVAEFLAAQYASTRINNGLPINRILALICGEDGGIIPDLRGFAAWLAAHNKNARLALIERDALGVVLYGDVRSFPVEDKKRVLDALHAEAERYPWFRSEDWADSQFGALGTGDMEPAFRAILSSSSSRAIADQSLLNCVLDAIRYGKAMPALARSLEDVVRDNGYSPYVRRNAVEALIHGAHADPALLHQLAQDICNGCVEDEENELIGELLYALYPSIIKPAEVFDYLRPQKSRTINIYRMFWHHELDRLSRDEDVPILLDQLAIKQRHGGEDLDGDDFDRMDGKLLARGIEVHGDSITDERLLAWMSIGSDEFSGPRFEKEEAQRIEAWFGKRPERYKALIDTAASECVKQPEPWSCMNKVVMRLHVANVSTDLETWWLEKAASESNEELAHFYFDQAVLPLRQSQSGSPYFPASELERLSPWIKSNPKFEIWVQVMVDNMEDWEKKRGKRQKKWEAKRKKEREDLLAFYREHIEAIRDGSAYPQILHDLALAYNGHIYDAKGDTPQERMNKFLDGDTALIDAATTSFRHTLDRSDLPTINEIADLAVEGRMHYIRPACLIGMEHRYRLDPEQALSLPDETLGRILMFRLTDGMGDEPEWFEMLTRTRPELVADAFLAYALPMLRAKHEHITGLHLLTGEKAYVEVSQLALPKLLGSFPTRAAVKQLRFVLDGLLKGAFRYLDKDMLSALVGRKATLKSMDEAQRVYWLASGMLLNPELYQDQLIGHVRKSMKRRSQLMSFLYSDFGRNSFPDWVSLSASVRSRLIEMFGQDVSDIRMNGLVTNEMRMSEMVSAYIQNLGRDPSKEASNELNRLLGLPSLSNWHNRLRIAQHDQRIIRRKTTFRQPAIAEVDSTLANLQPANAADLAALVMDHLQEIARRIRDGNTNDYKQYWSYREKNKQLSAPKPENDCRDALLSDLQQRLGRLNIDAQREGNYADDKRADIRVSFGGADGFSVPVEVKKDAHKDLWRSIREQLIAKYTRDPDTDGFGVYLVFWFGGKGMPLPHDGKRPKSAKELKEKLLETLLLEEGRKISVCVIDCALP